MSHIRDSAKDCSVQRRSSHRIPISRSDSSGSEPSLDDGTRREPSNCIDDKDDHDSNGYLVDNETYTSLLASRSVWHEIWFAIRRGAWYILLSTAIGAIACFTVITQSTAHEKGAGAENTPSLPGRRIPSAEEQQAIHFARMRGATTIQMGHTKLILQTTTAVGTSGHLRLPGEFYRGMHLGLSAWDEWGEKLRDEDNASRNAALKMMLEELDPRPTAVYNTIFEGGVEGYTVAYLAGALSRQAGRDVHGRMDSVWAEAEAAVMKIAREYQQLTVTKWYPEVWGPIHETDELRHTTVLQEVRPTRTGLRRLASSVVVYRVAKAQPVDDGTTTAGSGDAKDVESRP